MAQSIETEYPCLATSCQERVEELEDQVLLLQGEIEGINDQLELYNSIFRMIRDQLNFALGDD
tara:strand:+ start:51 stop:239 length:189 start_codon:yes stop_codon:yes gene_type:complete